MENPSPVSKKMAVAGWIVSVLPSLMLLFSAAMKFARPPEVLEGFTHLGYPHQLAVPLGIVELVCALLYLFPRTCVCGMSPQSVASCAIATSVLTS